MNALDQALTHLEEYRTSDRLIRRQWTGEKDGKETACLLAALSDHVRASHSPSECPAEILDPWFAHLTPWFDDAGSLEAWPNMVARYGRVVRKLMSLPPERRYQLEYASRALIVREAMSYTTNQEAIAACEEVAQLCEQVAAGAPRDDKAFAAATAAATEAAAWATADRITTQIFDLIEAA